MGIIMNKTSSVKGVAKVKKNKKNGAMQKEGFIRIQYLN